MTNPLHKPHPEREFMVQKYMLLHSQHDALQQHLTVITTPSPETTGSSSPSYSPERRLSLSSSPSDSNGSNSLPFGHHYSHHHRTFPTTSRRHMSTSSAISPRSSVSSTSSNNSNNDNFINPFNPSARRYSLPTALDESILNEIQSDEHKLRNVNLQIKTTLTDLLNCEDVRCDSRYRTWVQERLMDAEMELKGGRCRSRERRVSEDARRLGYL
ncbi:hypothetical protein B7463_g2987, partial [Scytalidium lignicola]